MANSELENSRIVLTATVTELVQRLEEVVIERYAPGSSCMLVRSEGGVWGAGSGRGVGGGRGAGGGGRSRSMRVVVPPSGDLVPNSAVVLIMNWCLILSTPHFAVPIVRTSLVSVPFKATDVISIGGDRRRLCWTGP